MNLDALENGYTETQIKGTLNVHGEDKEIEVPAKIYRSDDELRITGGFTVEVADFDIKIPAVVRNNIARTIKVSFNLTHEPYKN
jgi:polyisoprenoid-binding protein YceI